MPDFVTVLVNGYQLDVHPKFSPRAPKDAAATNCLIVKFAPDVDVRAANSREEGLQVFDALQKGVFVCKFEPRPVDAILRDHTITHFTLYPPEIVPHNNLNIYNPSMEFSIELHPDPNPTHTERELLRFICTAYNLCHALKPRNYMSRALG